MTNPIEPTPAPELPVDDEALVERVAKAMYQRQCPRGNWDTDLGRNSYFRLACAAVAAIRSAPGVRRVYVNVYEGVTVLVVVGAHATAEEARSKALKHAEAVAVPLEWTVPGGGKCRGEP